jgi:putative oxidoreductase
VTAVPIPEVPVSRTFPLARFAPQLLSVLRIVVAFLFVTHGTAKLFHFPADPASPPMNFPMFSQFWFAGVLETFGGFLLLIGLFTRPVAFLLAGEMAVAYFQVHAKMGFWPTLNHGEAPVLFCFIWLYFAAAGAGPWSVDAAMRKGSA